jgi:hypothetical protein
MHEMFGITGVCRVLDLNGTDEALCYARARTGVNGEWFRFSVDCKLKYEKGVSPQTNK